MPYKIIKTYADAIEVSHPKPVNYISADEKLFQEWEKYRTFPHDLFELKDVCISNQGIVFKGLKHFDKALPHPIFRNQFGIFYLLTQKIFYKKNDMSNDNSHIILFDHWSCNNYYHWIIDSLCRLYIIKNELQNLTLLLPENPPEYILQSLGYFDCTNILFIKKNEYLQLKNLLVPNYAAWSGQQHPFVIKQLRDYMVNKTTISSNLNYDKVYVSRGKQKARRVSNDKEVINILTRYGFKVVYFEEMDLEQQIALMKGVKHFVTSHGANLTNMLFMPEGSKVLELLRNDKPNFCYWSMADCLGLKYYYQLCSIEKEDHLAVDTIHLISNLELFLS